MNIPPKQFFQLSPPQILLLQEGLNKILEQENSSSSDKKPTPEMIKKGEETLAMQIKQAKSQGKKTLSLRDLQLMGA